MNMNQSLNLKVVSNFDEFRKLNAVWNRLLEQSNNNRVYMSHEWFSSWWQAFGKGKELYVILSHHKDEVVGIAPMMRIKRTFRGMPVRSMEFMESEDSPGCGFIIREGYEQVSEAVVSFLAQTGGWDIICLKNILLDEELHNLIVNIFARTGKRHLIHNGLNSPFVKIDGVWEEYFKRLSSKSKKTIRNICNRIEKLGRVEVKELKNMEKFDDIITIIKKGWKYKEGKAFINHKEREVFFSLFSEYAQKKGWLSLWCAYKDDEPLAYEYHLKYNGSVTALLAEFSLDYKNYSPGAYLDFRIMQSLFTNNCREYDMCGSQDIYKRKWTKDIRDLKNITVFNNSLYSGGLFFIEEKAVPILKEIRRLIKR